MASGRTDTHRPAHGGQEIVDVPEGRVDLKVADHGLELGPGDCAIHDGGLPHGLRRLGPERARVLVIIAGLAGCTGVALCAGGPRSRVENP